MKGKLQKSGMKLYKLVRKSETGLFSTNYRKDQYFHIHIFGFCNIC